MFNVNPTSCEIDEFVCIRLLRETLRPLFVWLISNRLLLVVGLNQGNLGFLRKFEPGRPKPQNLDEDLLVASVLPWKRVSNFPPAPAVIVPVLFTPHKLMVGAG